MNTDDVKQKLRDRRQNPRGQMPKGKLAALPSRIRAEINHKIREGWRLVTIQGWLFDQKAETDIPDLQLKPGDPFSLVWTRDSQREDMAAQCCEQALSFWRRTHYQRWLADETRREESLRLLERADELDTAATKKGQPAVGAGLNVLVRSQLFDVIDQIRGENKDPAAIARLTNAWARMSKACMEVETFKLRRQKALDLGMAELRDEIKSNPDALEAFNNLRAVVKQSANRPASQ